MYYIACNIHIRNIFTISGTWNLILILFFGYSWDESFHVFIGQLFFPVGDCESSYFQFLLELLNFCIDFFLRVLHILKTLILCYIQIRVFQFILLHQLVKCFFFVIAKFWDTFELNLSPFIVIF